MPFQLQQYLQKHDRSAIFSVILLACAVHLPFINNPFFFDDYSIFTDHASRFYGGAIRILELRWLPYATLVWTNLLFLDHPIPFRIGNLLIHTANSFLLFLLLKQYLTALSLNDFKPQKISVLVLISCLMFLAHPTTVYTVGYVIQRSIMLATFFVLAMHFSYTHALLHGKKGGLVLAVAMFFLAVFSKEHSIMAIFTLVASTVLFWDQRKLGFRSLIFTFAALSLIAMLLLLRIKGIFGSSYEAGASQLLTQQNVIEPQQTTHLFSVLTQAGLFFKYLMLWLVPNPAWMSIDMREGFVSDVTSWKSWLGLIAFCVYGLLASLLLLRRGRLGLLGWALLYPWLLFFVEFSTIRVQEPFVIYRSYMWFTGLTAAVCVAGSLISFKKLITTGLTILVIMVPLSWNRLWVFSDHYLMWDDAAALVKDETTPGAARIYYNRGNAELAKKKWDDALADFKRVIRINPSMEQPYNNVATIYFNQGKYALALEFFDMAISKNVDYAQAYFGKAVTLKRLGMEVESQAVMQKSCALSHHIACLVLDVQKH